MNGPHRVVVTGVGVISPVGLDARTYWASLVAGASGIGVPTTVPLELLQQEPVAEVHGFVAADHFAERDISALDRVSQFAVVAAREAIAQSGLRFDGRLTERTATIVGTGIAGIGTIDASYKRLYGEKNPRTHPLTVPKIMPSAPASQVTMYCGLKGPSFGIVSACASATHAIGLAFQMVRAGIADVAVAGGAEASIYYGTLKAWEALRVMAPDTCRPFSRDRRGLVLGEGAAIVVLERLADASARGADILGEVVGFGASADAADLTNPDVDGMRRAIAACLEDAHLAADDVQYVNAHGTGTLPNDTAETAAIKAAFGGPAARRLAISSTKSMVGHALGAAGALEFVATLNAIRDRTAPPTMNYLGPDPACDLDYVPNAARAMRIDAALTNSFAFGGLNAVLALRRLQ